MNKHKFWRRRVAVPAEFQPSSCCFSKAQPTRGTVAYAAKMFRIDKGLHQHRAIAPTGLTIILNPPGKLTKNMARKMRYADPRKQNEPTVIDHPREILKTLPYRPADPFVPTTKRPSRAGEQDAPHPAPPRDNEVPKRAAKRRFESQRMIPLDKLVPQSCRIVPLDPFKVNRLHHFESTFDQRLRLRAFTQRRFPAAPIRLSPLLLFGRELEHAQLFQFFKKLCASPQLRLTGRTKPIPMITQRPSQLLAAQPKT